MQINPDWAMVIITAIYVAATIFIYLANNKSAKISKDQLTLSKEQYEETKRLSLMPFLQLSKASGEANGDVFEVALCDEESDDDTFYFIARIRNIGNGTAINTIFTWKCKELNISETDYFRCNAIRAGEEIKCQFTIRINSNTFESLHPVIEFQYDDLMGKTYIQHVQLSFDDEFIDVKCETDVPKYVGVIMYKKAE